MRISQATLSQMSPGAPTLSSCNLPAVPQALTIHLQLAGQERLMSTKNYWQGFAIGALSGVSAGLASVFAWNFLSSSVNRRVLRLQKSVQIGRPVREVFEAWTNLQDLPLLSGLIKRVEEIGDRSRWIVNVDGRDISWDAEIVQLIPNQAIGWKSLRGPKHTGR